MKFIVLFAVFVLYLPRFESTFYESNITDFSKCRVHYSIQEDSYKVFYHFDDLDLPGEDNRTILDFHFSVLSMSDAHVLLAPSAQLTKNDPVYEIVIGAGGNSFSDIRRMQKKGVRASKRMKGLLSAVDVRSFWIHVYRDGTIDVGKEGEELAFLSWKDTDLLPLKVFSFCTWGSVEAKWFFDCPRGNKSANSEEVEVVLTPLEKLRKDLLTGYSPYVRPAVDFKQSTLVTMKFDVLFIHLEESKSTFNLKGSCVIKWKDEKLKWNPADYDGVKSMHVYHGEVWKPDLIISNSAQPGETDPFDGRLIVVSSNGSIIWKPAIDSLTLCNISSLLHWPNDVHVCDLDVAFWSETSKLRINVDGLKKFENGNDRVGEWEIIQLVATHDYERTPEFYHPGLKLQIKMKRISDLYTRTLFTPFIVIATLMLLTFWSSPFGHLKITLACVQMLLSIITLIGISIKLPQHSYDVPFLVTLYSATIAANVVCVMVAILVINLSRNEHVYAPPHYIVKILNLKCMEMMLLLPAGEVGAWYGKLKRDSSFAEKSIQEKWIRLATAIDRTTFFAFALAVSAPFFLKY